MRSPFVLDSRPGARLLRAVAGAMPLALLAACDLPTEVPKSPILDLRWVVPSQSTRITVANLLPIDGSVTILPDSSGFAVTVAAASVTRTLSQDCAACVAANGFTAPKPAFVASASISTAVPADISTATLTGGTLQVVVNNGYTFDPLFPNPVAGTPTGYAVIIVSSAGNVIGKDSVNGATSKLPPGGSLSRTIPLLGTLTGSAPVVVTLSLNSPAGEPVRIDASRSISVTATPTGLRVVNASVAVVNRRVTSSSTIDLTDVDSTIINRVQSGALLLTIVNPFTVTGTLTVELTPQGGATITRTVALAAGSSTPPPITFTGAELKSLLGRKVTISYAGAVNSTAGPVSISPRQAVVVTTRLDIKLQVGG